MLLLRSDHCLMTDLLLYSDLYLLSKAVCHFDHKIKARIIPAALESGNVGLLRTNTLCQHLLCDLLRFPCFPELSDQLIAGSQLFFCKMSSFFFVFQKYSSPRSANCISFIIFFFHSVFKLSYMITFVKKMAKNQHFSQTLFFLFSCSFFPCILYRDMIEYFLLERFA